MGDQNFHLLCIGISHQTASIALREQLAFTPYMLEAGLSRLVCGNGSCPREIRELLILSTCNRVEMYAVSTTDCFDHLESFLSEVKNIPAEQFSSSLFRLKDEAVPHHLFTVAAGLDSVVLGEPQILGQVTDAFTAARQQGTAGKILSRLFQTAIHVGKRVRTETVIAQNPASIASVAVHLISQKVDSLSNARIMVLGAGEMAELAVEALRKRGVHRIFVVNRTLQHAQELARRWNGEAASLEMLLELLPAVDIVIASTGAPHTIIRAPMVQQAIAQRPNRVMVFMDIAVPRDVDPQVGEIPGVSLFDIDSLSEHLENGIARREAEVPHAQEIITEELDGFMKYLAALDVIPLIVQLRKRANAIRIAEIEKNCRRIPNLSPEAHDHIDALTKSIVNKILHDPTVCLRREANGPNAYDYADLTRHLFGLEEPWAVND
jgi:glutamyl-tRNA reductase